MSINWITRKVKSLFPLKTKTFIQSARYHGFSSCKEKYISESNVIHRIDGENITILPMIWSQKNI